jgi:predicted Rdx family selenoprotein
VSDEILELGGHQVNLVAGSGGVFKVTAEGRTIFSKADSNRFPEPGEIAGALAGE